MAALEDALLAANRGEGRLVAVAGEAGMGKTRLLAELSRRARKLGFEILWGGCSEVDLALPYLPFVEAIGNHLATADIGALVERLGPTRSVLAQLFPQLGSPEGTDQLGDPGSAKVRLFESIVGLLGILARESGLLLVVDDAHWADASTREFLDHLARRLPSMRALTVVTYRSDELDRRHPLQPILQAWRRSRLVETLALEPLSRNAVTGMIRAIFEEDSVSPELVELMHVRCEGNPFVLEEILREAIDRGDLFRAERGWDRKPIEAFSIPASVRDTIVQRLSRLEPTHIATLEAASVLGRRFEHLMLATMTDANGDALDAALALAIGQQLIEADPQTPGGFRWRHALTQEAIYDEIVLPRRQRLHSRAADALAANGTAAQRAHHLLEAARFAEAVEQSLQAAVEAEAAAATLDAAMLYERVLPHVVDERQRAEVTCRLGVAYSFSDQSGRAAEILSDGVRMLDRLGEDVRAAHFRLNLGRNWWIKMRPDLALIEYRRARDVLEPLGPSADLASLYFQEASQKLFENDFAACLAGMKRAHEIAAEVGAERQRIHSLSFMGLAMIDLNEVDRGLAMIEEAYRQACDGGFRFIASNSQWNDVWLRTHLMIPNAERSVARVEELDAAIGRPDPAWTLISRSYLRRTRGDLAGALEDATATFVEATRLENTKLIWRSRVQLGEVLTEMGRVDEALERLPWPPEEAEAQDHVYEAPAQIHARLTAGHIDEAARVAELVHANRDLVANYAETLSVGVEAFLAAGLIDKAHDLLSAGKARGFSAGGAWLREAEARILLETGDPDRAHAILPTAIDEAEEAGFRIAATRMRVVAGRALAGAGDVGAAESVLRRAAADADRMGASLLGDEARAEAMAFGAHLPVQTPAQPLREEELLPTGERMITSMFADIRGYTSMTVETPPEQMHERLTSFYRLAKIEVERNGGLIDKFAGDAVMATFNVSGSSVDHPLRTLKTALGIRDRAALMDLPIGIGIAVGPAVVGHSVEGANMMVMGSSVNLAARLQTAASAGEVILSEDVQRRVAQWLEERGIETIREELQLKGFDSAQVAYRIPSASH
jgi:class 3 adenylate cyclase